MTSQPSSAPQQPTEFTLEPQPDGPRIDARASIFGANITWVLLAITLVANLVEGPGNPAATIGQRLGTVSWLLFLVIGLLFAWGAFWGSATHPWGVVYRKFVQPRLAAPTRFENPKPPRFAQLVGFLFAAVGLILGAIGVPFGLFIPTLFAFIAAFLNGVFGFCLGCQMFLLLARARLVRL